jgi:hypothetical protein
LQHTATTMAAGSPKHSQAKPVAKQHKRHNKVLHFFPGEHAVIWVVDGKRVMRAEAWGGTAPTPGQVYE